MIRFMPDTLLDAIMRPIALAAPNAWVYIEITAPDIRFAMVLLLALVSAAVSLWRGWKSAPTWILFAFVAVCFIPWMYTTGNGRYFMPVLLAAGPLTVAVVYHLPVTKAFRLALTLLAIGVQGVALMVNSPWKPWDSWELVRWREAPYFHLDLQSQQLNPDATYVTISAISFSLLAPQFPRSSHWINISSAAGAGPASPETRRTQAFLRSARALELLLPSVPASMDSGFQPDSVAIAAIDKLLVGQRLALQKPVKCRFLRSSSLLDMTLVKTDDDVAAQAEKTRRVGFWMCPLAYPSQVQHGPDPIQASAEPDAAKAEMVLQKVEALCPRFFAPGQIGTQPMKGGRTRHYPSADVLVYVLDDGRVYYKYERSMNPHQLGTADGLLKGTEKPDCKIRGRSGLPWERAV